MEERKVRVAITHGDTNGIGYELIFKTFASPEILDLCTPIIYGSPKIAAYHRKALGIESAFSIISSAEEARDGRVNLLTCFEEEVKVELGNKTQEGEQAGAKALKRALEDQKTGAYDVLVMAPLEKNSVVEQLGLLVMMNENLRVAFATNAIDLKEVAQKITKERVVSKATAIFDMLRRDLRISNPRVAVLALNPNADGTEEAEAIVPALQELEASGRQAFGPYPAAKFFGEGMYAAFDAVLAMYHDQGAVPLTTLAADDNIIYVAGLSMPCTAASDDVDYEHAGKGITDENAFRQAIYYAIDAFRNRINYDEPLVNPLPKLYHEKREDGEKVRFAIPKK